MNAYYGMDLKMERVVPFFEDWAASKMSHV